VSYLKRCGATGGSSETKSRLFFGLQVMVKSLQ